jgi:large subunit ribosomal protein L23
MGILDNIAKRAKKITAKKLEYKKSVDKAEKPASAKATADKKAEKSEDKKVVAKPARRSPKGGGGKKKSDKPAFGPLARELGGKSATVLLAPVLTEKSSRQESLGKYVFFVSSGTTKVEVAEAIRDLYGVKPTSVRIANVKGKKVRFGRVQGRKKDRKKAIITLKKGDAISI